MIAQDKLTAAEVSQLWPTYMANSMFKAHLQYFLAHCDDPAIGSVLDFALRLSNKILNGVQRLLEEAGYPTPIAFTENDLYVNAPRLYTDHFYLFNIHNLAQYGLIGHSHSLTVSGRADVRDFFTECVTETSELYNQATELLIKKGIYPFQPVLPASNKVDFVERKSFLTGWFGERRPLSAIEINNVFSDLIGTAIGRAICMSFSQTAKSKEIRAFFLKGAQLARDHIATLQDILSENELPSPPTFESEVTHSTEAPFSDKLMLYKVQSLSVIASARYGLSLGHGGRRDIGALYGKMIVSVLKYSEEGAKITIERGWLEQPPLSVDREALARV